jgi:hypothetical protein
MAIHPTSFFLGLGAAWALPLVTRAFRPVAVQVTAAGMGIFDEVRRVIAEQAELMQDIAAEARARREELAVEGELDETEDGGVEESPAPERARRRTNGARRRAS